LLDSTAHITNRSGRRLRGRHSLGYRRVRNGLADEGSRSFVNQQWGGCNGTQGNARRSHRRTIIAEHSDEPTPTTAMSISLRGMKRK